MLMVKIGITLIVLGYPTTMVGKIWGDPSPFHMNGADNIGIVGFYMLVSGIIVGGIGTLMALWGM